MVEADFLLHGASQLLTMEERAGGGGERGLGVVEGGAVASLGGRIVWVGESRSAGAEVSLTAGASVHDACGRVVLPGLVDPHTHLVFAGSRHEEFALRLAGADYLRILAAGGGILSTVRSTRAASTEELVASASSRLDRLLSFGVTTCEIKSGYGLDTASELRMLEVAQAVDAVHSVRVVATFLGAHVVPPEHAGHTDGYVDAVCAEMIPEVAARGLARMCDVFLDRGAFDAAQAERILATGAAHGLVPRLHAGQFTDLGGPELAARLGAASADHLEHFSDGGAAAMAAAGVVACLLPGAALSLGMRFPDASRLRRAGVEIALATDCNPGTSRTENLPLMTTLAMTSMGLTAEEALRGVTIAAARALRLGDEIGSLAAGKWADLAVFDVPDYRCIPYHFGVAHAVEVFVAGARAHTA